MKLLNIFILLALSVACIKTADQVQREKRFDSMSEQMKDSQGLVADLVTQMKDLQSQIDRLNGRIEEMEHKNQKVNPEQISQTHDTVNLMKTQQESQGAQLLQIQNELKEQRTFIEKVTEKLSHHAAQAQAPAKSQKKSAKSELADALDLVKNNQYDEARTQLEGMIESPDLTPGDHNKVLHGLGRVEFYTKNYDKALVYFSKIYSKYPHASLSPSSLLFIGKCLDKMGKKDEAKEAFKKVTEDYAGSKEAQEAKKEI